jgi:ubiquinone/menaquinone biosynthesis C-methylase UbiE
MHSLAKWVDYDAGFVRRRYDRLARFFVFFEWLFLLPPGIRRKAVARLGLKPGGRVLEVGCGTGRNLPALRAAVGDEGRVYGVDVSEGMLAKAREACARAGWGNVTLVRADAAEYELPEPVDGVIFSLSYAVMPHHRQALARAWAQLRPGGSLVVMDAKLPSGALGRLLHPFVVWASRLTVLGNPDVRPWDDLRELTREVEYEEVQFGTYYILTGRKANEG